MLAAARKYDMGVAAEHISGKEDGLSCGLTLIIREEDNLDWPYRRAELESVQEDGLDWPYCRTELKTVQEDGLDWPCRRAEIESVQEDDLDWPHRRAELESVQEDGLDWPCRRAELESVQEEARQRLTLDGGADSVGSKAHVSRFCSGADSFLSWHVRGERIYADPELHDCAFQGPTHGPLAVIYPSSYPPGKELQDLSRTLCQRCGGVNAVAGLLLRGVRDLPRFIAQPLDHGLPAAATGILGHDLPAAATGILGHDLPAAATGILGHAAYAVEMRPCQVSTARTHLHGVPACHVELRTLLQQVGIQDEHGQLLHLADPCKHSLVRSGAESTARIGQTAQEGLHGQAGLDYSPVGGHLEVWA
ncbi:hypothetical protein CYMTET_36368 [Cymbomonas tetramitiformis]|uniref:Uncharacterized protein n=1 Tax=Cymbomonas tetramitiformis TaxID=36881 RepID=A0AAE0CG26_9CHLO|nr:hypothetical protein CYMTET_36368 [Cymbomonas tetramitiformis]